MIVGPCIGLALGGGLAIGIGLVVGVCVVKKLGLSLFSCFDCGCFVRSPADPALKRVEDLDEVQVRRGMPM